MYRYRAGACGQRRHAGGYNFLFLTILFARPRFSPFKAAARCTAKGKTSFRPTPSWLAADFLTLRIKGTLWKMRIVQTRRARLREHAEAHPARLFWTFLSYQNLPGLSTHFSVFFAIFYCLPPVPRPAWGGNFGRGRAPPPRPFSTARRGHYLLWPPGGRRLPRPPSSARGKSSSHHPGRGPGAWKRPSAPHREWLRRR